MHATTECCTVMDGCHQEMDGHQKEWSMSVYCIIVYIIWQLSKDIQDPMMLGMHHRRSQFVSINPFFLQKKKLVTSRNYFFIYKNHLGNNQILEMLQQSLHQPIGNCLEHHCLPFGHEAGQVQNGKLGVPEKRKKDQSLLISKKIIILI